MIGSSKVNQINASKGFRPNNILIAAGLMAIPIILGLLLIFFDERTWDIYVQVRLLPWIGATAVVLAAPAVYQFYKGKFDFFHPLVHACWFYWFPAFVVGGLLLATDLINPYQLTLVRDPESDFIWSYIYIIISFASMTLGFYLPLGRWGGEYASRKLPAWDWQPRQVFLPAIVFLIIGSYFFIIPFFSNLFGVPIIGNTDPLSTLNFTLTYLTLEAGFLAAIYIFKARALTVEHLIAWGIIGFLLVSKISLTASRSSILAIIVILVMAYLYSGRKFTKKAGAVFAVLAAAGLIAGIIYGTTFRSVKGSEDQLSFDKQVETVGATLDTIGTQSSGKVFNDSLNTLGERIDGISTVAVVVGNYERLKPYEAAYDIENNIWRDLWTSFVPRIVWADKPVIFNMRGYSDLYFNFDGSSFALTPTCDLLRNYGPFGIPIGMILIGIFLRFVYAALIENQKITIGRATAYYLFLVSLSYEGFYATIFINGIRIFFITILTFLIAEFFLIPRRKFIF